MENLGNLNAISKVLTDNDITDTIAEDSEAAIKSKAVYILSSDFSEKIGDIDTALDKILGV